MKVRPVINWFLCASLASYQAWVFIYQKFLEMFLYSMLKIKFTMFVGTVKSQIYQLCGVHSYACSSAINHLELPRVCT